MSEIETLKQKLEAAEATLAEAEGPLKNLQDEYWSCRAIRDRIRRGQIEETPSADGVLVSPENREVEIERRLRDLEHSIRVKEEEVKPLRQAVYLIAIELQAAKVKEAEKALASKTEDLKAATEAFGRKLSLRQQAQARVEGENEALTNLRARGA